MITGMMERSIVEMYFNAERDQYLPERRRHKKIKSLSKAPPTTKLSRVPLKPKYSHLGQYVDIYV